MTDDNSLFCRMLRNHGPIAEAAKQIAELKQQAAEKPEDKLKLSEFDKDFLHEMKVKA